MNIFSKMFTFRTNPYAKELERNLAERRVARKIEQRRKSQAYWNAVRKHHANDPLMRGVRS